MFLELIIVHKKIVIGRGVVYVKDSIFVSGVDRCKATIKDHIFHVEMHSYLYVQHIQLIIKTCVYRHTIKLYFCLRVCVCVYSCTYVGKYMLWLSRHSEC